MVATVRDRTNKDGSVTHQVMFRDGGRQRSRSFGSAKGAEKFRKLVDAVGPQRALEELEAPVRGATLDELAAEFFDFKEARVRSERTVSDYRRDYRNWIAPTFGNRAAAGISEREVQAWVDDLVGKLNPKTIAGHHALLGSIFKWGAAPSRKYLPPSFNPCGLTELPTRLKKPPKGMRINAWLAMHSALRTIGEQKGCGEDAADLGQFLVATGWRISEGIALDESGCDDDGYLITCHVLQVVRRRADGTTRIVEDAKSRAGRRRVTLDPDTSAMVRRRLARVQRGQLVFTRAGARWHYNTFRAGYWVPALEAANLPWTTPHELRHAAVGIFHASGASLAEIQRRIGHESIKTTIDVYGGLIDDMDTRALDNVAALLRGEQVNRRGEQRALDA